MLVFIDESGSFLPPTTRPIGVSCVAGLIIPHRRYRKLQAGFASLKVSWGVAPSAEVKGSQMDEEQVASVVDLLLANRATCCGVVYDGSLTSDAVLTAHKLEQARGITRHVGRQHAYEVRKRIIAMRRQLREMPNQLYVQAKALSSLCEDCLQTILVEYPHTHPGELGNIEIFVDAKERQRTPFESYWQLAILPEIQNRSFRNPPGMIAGADYTHFDRSYRGQSDRVPPHLADLLPDCAGPFEYTKIGEIFRDIRIQPSHENVGLQLADVVANTLTRVMKGNLQLTGWRRFPRLFINRSAGALTLLLFSQIPRRLPPPLYQARVAEIHQRSRSCAFHRFSRS